ncbi:MAG: XisI protein [bacterium]|nr:XisI protein [bacterium]
MMIGWEGPRRVHGALIHVDIIDAKIWIQRDGTEDGIAGELEDAGVSRSDIVLGFREPSVRPYTGYAVA